MNEILEHFLLIILFIFGFGFSMSELFKIDRNFKSKKFKDKKKAYKDLKSVGDDNLQSIGVNIIADLFKKIF